MSNLMQQNSWSTRWQPTSEQHARRQFELVNDTYDHDSPGRPFGNHAHGQFCQPLAMGGPQRTGGYHLSYDGKGVADAQPIPAKRQRIGPGDLDDCFARCDFNVDQAGDSLPECVGDPWEYVDETGDVLEDNVKRKHPAQYSVSWLDVPHLSAEF